MTYVFFPNIFYVLIFKILTSFHTIWWSSSKACWADVDLSKWPSSATCRLGSATGQVHWKRGPVVSYWLCKGKSVWWCIRSDVNRQTDRIINVLNTSRTDRLALYKGLFVSIHLEWLTATEGKDRKTLRYWAWMALECCCAVVHRIAQ